MDELGGWLIGIVLAIVAIIAVVKFMFLAMGFAFVALSGLMGHPIFLVVLLATIGAIGGLIRSGRQTGKVVARSSDDYAEIGALRMIPEHWAVFVLVALAVVLFLYGAFIV